MDVRDSDIEDLFEMVAKKKYNRYLARMTLKNVRAFENQEIVFDFPVTAVIGTNGGGKSTILGAAGIAYIDVKPGDFFPKSNVSDTSMANWRIDYEILDRDKLTNGLLPRNARFVAAKWRRDDLLTRQVRLFPIFRTVPAGEQTRYKRFIGIYQQKAIITDIDDIVKCNAGRILGKDLDGYKIAHAKGDPTNYILLGKQKANEFSQFHFGAGEASIIEMVLQIEKLEQNSLVLIEEIENGLHPIATTRMVEYLIGVAKRKKCQIIFTTHSEYALKCLPDKAVWACIDGIAYQGRLSIEGLRAMTGHTEKESIVFVEDAFAKDWVDDIIRQHIKDGPLSYEVHAGGGYPNVMNVALYHNNNPSISKTAKAIVDGDATADELPEFAIKLPGGMPEREIFLAIHKDIESFSALIQQRCHIPHILQDIITKTVKNAKTSTTDYHLVFAKIGQDLGFISEIVVRRAFISLYNERFKERLGDVVSFLLRNDKKKI